MKEDEVKISDEQRESCRMPSADGLEAARLYLESYRHGCRMLRADRYAREYFDDGFDRDDEEKREDELDLSLVRARLCAVRSFVSSLPCGETGRMLLYYHYIRNSGRGMRRNARPFARGCIQATPTRPCSSRTCARAEPRHNSHAQITSRAASSRIYRRRAEKNNTEPK